MSTTDSHFRQQQEQHQQQQSPGQPYPGQQYPGQQRSSVPAHNPSTALSVTSLVLGLVSIVAGFTFFVPIAGLIVGILGFQREPNGHMMAIWGIVLNCVILFGLVLVILAILVFGFAFLPFAIARAAF